MRKCCSGCMRRWRRLGRRISDGPTCQPPEQGMQNVRSRFRAHSWRSSLRTTSFNSDQPSLTTQTFPSAKPTRSARWRIASSVTVLGTLDAFISQETHNAASGLSFFRRRRRCSVSSSFFVRVRVPRWPACPVMTLTNNPQAQHAKEQGVPGKTRTAATSANH